MSDPDMPTQAVRASKDIKTPAHSPFHQLRDVLSLHYYKPDFQAIRVVLGAISAHYLGIGDPAWLFIVAPPGTGKTTMAILGASELRQVIPLGDFTERTFLSGFYGRQTPGLLEKIGETVKDGTTHTCDGDAVFVAKDFTTVLSMRRETRAVILSQLREIHDGEFRRSFGTGETKIWRGRVSIIAAVTPVLDRHYSIFSVLGERFLQVRWHRPDCEEAGDWAIRQQGNEHEIQRLAREAISRIFDGTRDSPPELSAEMRTRISAMAEITALSRTHVFRSSYGKREIEYVPEAEANTRISKGLAALAKGIAALSGHSTVGEDEMRDAWRVAIDCLPEYRRRIFNTLLKQNDLQALRIPRTVLARELEDLRELEILTEECSFTQKIRNLLSTARVDEVQKQNVPMCSG